MQARIKKYTPFFSIVAAIMVLIAGRAAHGQSACEVRLPQGEATMIVDVNEYKACSMLSTFQSLLIADLSGLPSGYDITNGTTNNNGFCADLNGTILDYDTPPLSGAIYTTKFYSSLDPSLPLELRTSGSETIPWNKINYVLNQYQQDNWLDVQAAIWSLFNPGCHVNTQPSGGPLFYCDPYRPLPYPFPLGADNRGCQNFVNAGRVQGIVADANTNGVTFTPGPGQRVAIVVDATKCTGSSYCDNPAYLPFQVLFIPRTCCSGWIGDFVWHDLNGNGLQDAGEPGIDGVTVNLKNSSGAVIASTTTAVNGTQHGYYQFTGLCKGTYYVEVVTPSPFTPTIPFGNDQTTPKDSNSSPAQVDLSADNSSNDTIDFGFVARCSGSIGDFVWYDVNHNGLQDGEPGIKGVKVSLTGTDTYGEFVSMTATTDVNGKYSFTGLCQGDYVVTVETNTLPSTDYTPTTKCSNNQLIDNDSNSDIAAPTCTPKQTVNLGGDSIENLTIDFGFVTPCSGSIGDFVWLDLNGNGIQDDGEPGINGVKVTLSGTATGTTITALWPTGNGYYQFTGLCAGTYTVTVDQTTLPPGYTATTSNATGSTPANDSNGSPATLTLTTDTSFDQTIDFGYVSPASSLGDFVWADKNGNGIQDQGESGIPGVTVKLYDCSGTSKGQTTTDANGFYTFSNLTPGSYYVHFDKPAAGYTGFSPQYAQGADPSFINNTDSNANSSGKTDCVTLGAGENNLTIDAGLIPPCGIEVTKGCAITPSSTTPFVCCDTKPIDKMIVKWNGTLPVTVTAWNGSVGTGTPLYFGNSADPVMPGEVVMFTRSGTYPNDIYWQIFNVDGSIYHSVAGDKGLSTFHLSCSDVNMDGPEDCGLAAGNGKGQLGYINEWIFGGLGGKGVQFTCPGFQTSEPTDVCQFTPTPVAPFVCSAAKPLDSLTMQWNGTQKVRIKAWKGAVGSALLADIDNIAPGQEVRVSGYAGSQNDVIWEIFKAGTCTNKCGNTCTKIGQSTFHLSCSDVDMNGPEDCFKAEGNGKATDPSWINTWSFLGMAGNGRTLDCRNTNGHQAGTDVSYKYTITNPNDYPLTILSATDDKLGPITFPQSLGAGKSTSVTVPAFVTPDATNILTNIVSVKAAGDSFTTCEDSAQAMVKRIVSQPACDASTSIKADFNCTAIKAGSYIWFNSVVAVKNRGTDPAILRFTGSKILLNGVQYVVPDAEVRFTSVSQASTTFDGTKWVTEVPLGYTGNVFLSGLALPLPNGLRGGVKGVTWSGNMTTDKAGITASWKWAAAVYKTFSSDYNRINAKPVDGDKLNAYHNSDHAGTPEHFKAYVTGGARGSSGGGGCGGSNYTGSYTKAVSKTQCVSP